MRLRWVLIAVYLLAIVPLGALTLLAYRGEVEARLRFALNSSLASARLGATAVEAFLNANARTEEAAGSIILSTPHSKADATESLRRVQEDNPAFSSLALLNDKEQVMAEYPRGTELHLVPQMTRKITPRQPWLVSNLERFPDGTLRFHLLTGVRRGGKYIGFMDASIKDSVVNSLVNVRIGERGNVGVIDASGRAVTLTFAPSLPLRERYRGWIPSIRKALSGKAATIDSFYDPLSKIRRMGASVPVPRIGWVVNVFRPVDAVTETIVASARLLALRTLALSLLSLAAVLLLSHLIAEPLSELARATVAYGKEGGDLGRRVREDYFVTEIRDLSEAVNWTAAALQGELEREKYVADTLQRGLLPAEIAELKGYDIGSYYSSATKEAIVGGDFFEFINFGEGSLGIAIGDVQGHGIDAAMTTVMAKLFLRDLAGPNRSPAWVMQHLNEALCRHLQEPEQLITMFYGLLNRDSGLLTYSSAGHPPPLVCSPAGMCRTLASHQELLGLWPSVKYASADDVISYGELMCLYTDGVVEARRGREEFGQARVMDLLRQAGTAQDIAERLYRSCLEFSGGNLRDDVAVVVVRRL